MKQFRFGTCFLLLALVISVIPSLAVQDFYQAEFKGWRDNRTNPDFHALLERHEKQALISVPGSFEYGKVMTPEKAIAMNITSGLVLQIIIDEISEDGSMDVELMDAHRPYAGYKILNGITQPGIYSVSIMKSTPWKEIKDFWVTLWLGGSGAEAKVSQLRIGEGLALVNKPAQSLAKSEKSKVAKSLLAKGARKVKKDFRGDKSKSYKYFENWAKGLNGWRDNSIEKGLNTIAKVQKGGEILLKLKEKVTYGRFLSPKKPLTVDFSKYPYLEIELGRELERGKVRVHLIHARNPDNFRIITPRFSRAGVYMANVPDLTGWKTEQTFFIEFFLEGAGTQVALNAIGFSSKMATAQGIMLPIPGVKPEAIAPAKDADILKISGVAYQTYRAMWLDGVAKNEDWTGLNRWGIPLKDIGFNEITQKFYLISYIHPFENVDIWASLGYDIINEKNNVRWEEPAGRYLTPQLDYGLLRYQDLYIGNMAQLGTVYEPLFTDLTFKKASTFRGILWQPKLGDICFKLFGTRLSSSSSDYNKTNVFMTGLRAAKNFSIRIGTVQLGLSAVNLSKSNGEMDTNLFMGPDEPPEVYQNFVPSVYVKIENHTTNTTHPNESNLYFKTEDTNYMTIANSAGNPISPDFSPDVDDSSIAYVSDQSNTYIDLIDTDPNNAARGINEGGYLVLRVPLVLTTGANSGGRVLPSQIQAVSGHLELSCWHIPDDGTIDFSISSDGENWRLIESYSTFTTHEPVVDVDYTLTADQLERLKSGTFRDEGTQACSILGADLRGQLLGINLAAEYAVSIAHNQAYTGDRVNRMANAYFVTLSRGIEGALLKASYFNLSKDYSTKLLNYDVVEDNDSCALLPDWDTEKNGVIFGDFYNLGQPSQEYVNGLYIPQDYLFHESEDLNHNGILDSRENDHEPDYPYRRDQRGYSFSAIIPRQVLEGTYASNMEIRLDGHYIKRLSKPGRNQSVSLTLKYKNTDIDDWVFEVGAYGARIRDDISDQYALYTANDEEIPLTLDYTDNLTVTPELKVIYNAPFGLKMTLLDRFRLDQELDRERRRYYGNLATVDIRYKHYLLEEVFAMQPVYIGRFGGRQANASAPIHNTYYLPQGYEPDENWDVPIFHGLYLQNSVLFFNEYKFSLDFGREISCMSKHGQAEEIRDKLAVGLLRDLAGGYIRLHGEMNKVYFPFENEKNWGQNAVWAQVTVTF